MTPIEYLEIDSSFGASMCFLCICLTSSVSNPFHNPGFQVTK